MTAPTVAITRAGDRVTITFAGTLESAESATGRWTEATNTESPWTQELAGPQRFFRARGPGGTNDPRIFASTSVVQMTLTGPFQQHFNLAFAGTPDGIFPPVRQKPYFDGTVQVGAPGSPEIPVSLRVRGNSSLQECPFPKLKLKVSSENRADTPFADARELKIGSHCADGGRGNVGRLRDERAAFREALAYETMQLMGYLAPRVRRARIEYRDTSPTTIDTADGWPVTRQAMILEDVEVLAARLGGRALDDDEIGGLTKSRLRRATDRRVAALPRLARQLGLRTLTGRPGLVECRRR